MSQNEASIGEQGGQGRECLPIAQVLDTVLGVEREMARFYELAAEHAKNSELRGTFQHLLEEKKASGETLAKVCDSFTCGEGTVENASPDDIGFLSALVQTGFYNQAGSPADRFDPELTSAELVDNALGLERSLLLFYLKFYGISCPAHRPMFSELIRRGEAHVTRLGAERSRHRPAGSR